MEEFIKCDLEFEDEKLYLLVEQLKDCFDSNQNNFYNLCKTIYNIWSYCKGNYWPAKDNEYYNSYKLLAKFGFDKKAVSRYKQCYEKFITDDTIFNMVREFNPSKLYELLPLSQETIFEIVDKQLITPTMTVKEIREYIKTLKNDSSKALKVIEDVSSSDEINEEEIPMAYNPKQEYDYSYFETKTKNQLLNMIWDLQKEYQKLKKEKKNDKN